MLARLAPPGLQEARSPRRHVRDHRTRHVVPRRSMVRSPRGPFRAAPVGHAGCLPVSETPPDTRDLLAELERLRSVTSLMTAAVSQCSRDLRYRWVSPGYGIWIGRPAAEIVGRRIVDVLGPSAFEALRPHVERVLA